MPPIGKRDCAGCGKNNADRDTFRCTHCKTCVDNFLKNRALQEPLVLCPGAVCQGKAEKPVSEFVADRLFRGLHPKFTVCAECRDAPGALYSKWCSKCTRLHPIADFGGGSAVCQAGIDKVRQARAKDKAEGSTAGASDSPSPNQLPLVLSPHDPGLGNATVSPSPPLQEQQQLDLVIPDFPQGYDELIQMLPELEGDLELLKFELQDSGFVPMEEADDEAFGFFLAESYCSPSSELAATPAPAAPQAKADSDVLRRRSSEREARGGGARSMAVPAANRSEKKKASPAPAASAPPRAPASAPSAPMSFAFARSSSTTSSNSSSLSSLPTPKPTPAPTSQSLFLLARIDEISRQIQRAKEIRDQRSQNSGFVMMSNPGSPQTITAKTPHIPF
jgi:hypothetical protein